MKTKCVSNFSLQVCFYRTTSVRNIQISDCVNTVKTSFLQSILLSWSKLTKMSDNSNNVHFSGVRFICSPYLAIKSDLALLGPIMADAGRKWILRPQNEHYCKITDRDLFGGGGEGGREGLNFEIRIFLLLVTAAISFWVTKLVLYS